MGQRVEVRELRSRTSAILRRVRERGEVVDITYRGQVIARIVPVVPQAEADESLGAIWTDMDRLAAEIGQCWDPEGTSGAGTVGDQRRG